MEAVQSESSRRHLVQIAAYYLWRQRGCPVGTPEVDWFRAEQELSEQAGSSATTPLIAMATTLGSALGSVAGHVASVGGLVHSQPE